MLVGGLLPSIYSVVYSCMRTQQRDKLTFVSEERYLPRRSMSDQCPIKKVHSVRPVNLIWKQVSPRVALYILSTLGCLQVNGIKPRFIEKNRPFVHHFQYLTPEKSPVARRPKNYAIFDCRIGNPKWGPTGRFQVKIQDKSA